MPTPRRFRKSAPRRPAVASVFYGLEALAAPARSLGRDTSAVLAQPRAFFGGLAATALMCVGVIAALQANPAQAQVTDTAEVDFNAGVLTPLGVVMPEDVVVITIDTRTVPTPDTPEPVVEPETPESAPEQVTKDPTPTVKPKPEPTPVTTPKPKPKPLPEPPKPDGEIANQNSTSNNPYPDPPTVDQNPGDPFGDVNGWGELTKDGDPWATEVMRRLNAMSVPAWAAKVPNGRYSFRIKVCSNGRIDKVFTSTSSGDAGLDSVVKTEVLRTKLPPMPAKLQKQMSGSCSTLKYTFAWGGGRVR